MQEEWNHTMELNGKVKILFFCLSLEIELLYPLFNQSIELYEQPL